MAELPLPPSIRFYYFERDLLKKIEILREDERLLRREDSEEAKKLLNLLEKSFHSSDSKFFEDYIHEIYVLFSRFRDSDKKIRGEDVSQIAESVKTAVSSYVGIPLDFDVKIASHSDMKRLATEEMRRVYKELRRNEQPEGIISAHSFYSPLEKKLVVSNNMIDYPDPVLDFPLGPDNYSTSLWNEQILRTILTEDMIGMAFHFIRGETGKDFVRMNLSLPQTAREKIPLVQEAAIKYSLPELINERESIFSVLKSKYYYLQKGKDSLRYYLTFKTLADDLGFKVTCLFDAFPTPEEDKLGIISALWTYHPNFKEKDRLIREAVEKLPYKTDNFDIRYSSEVN